MTNIDDNTKQNSALKKKKRKKKKSQSGTLLGQLNNIAIYNMDGNDKIFIFTGIIKLEFKVKRGGQMWGTTMGETNMDIYRQSSPLCHVTVTSDWSPSPRSRTSLHIALEFNRNILLRICVLNLQTRLLHGRRKLGKETRSSGQNDGSQHEGEILRYLKL